MLISNFTIITKRDQFLARFGKDFDINDPLWGAWVKKGEHQSWSTEYQRLWEKWLNDNPSPNIQDAMKYAEELAEDYGYKVMWAE